LDEERYGRRYALAVRQIGPGAVTADVEAQVADIIDPTAHPLRKNSWNRRFSSSWNDRRCPIGVHRTGAMAAHLLQD
jgi:hypothetical protein